MAKVKFTVKAVVDLTGIWEYTLETWSEKQADKYYQLLINACSEIGANPQLGKAYFDIHPGLFGQPILKHVIFYRIIDKSSIEITRILHDRMDLRNKLNE